MSISTYNNWLSVLTVLLLVAAAVSLGSLIALIVNWKSPRRRGHAMRLVAGLQAIPCLIGIQQYMLWNLLLPEMRRQQEAEIASMRADRLVTTSLVQVGQQVPSLALTTVDGEQIHLPSSEKLWIVNFFATWCGPCQLELPHLQQIWDQYRDTPEVGLVVIGREETEGDVRAFRDQRGFSFPMVADPGREIYAKFATEIIPRTLVISPDGRLIHATVGFDQADMDQLRKLIEEHLNPASR